MDLVGDEADIVDRVGQMGDITSWFTQWASAALSEVCALGFDIEGAEKVCSFERTPSGYKATSPRRSVVHSVGTGFTVISGNPKGFPVKGMMEDLGRVARS
jgi:hypothetical protein